MKQIIKDVLEDLSKGQVNLGSEAAREMVATAIMSAIRTSDKGWFLDLNPSAKDYVYSGDLKDKSIDKLKYKIESESDYNDGWTKLHYMQQLSEIKDRLNSLEFLNNGCTSIILLPSNDTAFVPVIFKPPL